jgi:hypothetical protein
MGDIMPVVVEEGQKCFSGWLRAARRTGSNSNPGAGLNSKCGTGFSREGVGGYTADLIVRKLASSRLKPVPLKA